MCVLQKCFREPVNTVTHMVGALLAVAGLTLMVVFAAIQAQAWHVVSFSIFGATLILMYTSSFLYHMMKVSDEALKAFRRVDHIMIFMVIAGSYTPVCLVPLNGPWGWSLFGIVWGAALAGIFVKVFAINAPRWVSTAIYLCMGWICLVAVYPLVRVLDAGSLFWLVLGGLAYSLGAVIYAMKKPDPFPGILGFHEIWHLLVILGSFCHFWMSFKYLMHIPA